MQRQSLILLLQYLMQRSPVLAKIRQRQCLFGPKPAQLIFRSTVEVDCAIEGRCCKPFEFFGGVRLRVLQGVAKVSVSGHLEKSQRIRVANLSRVICDSQSLIEKLHRYVYI